MLLKAGHAEFNQKSTFSDIKSDHSRVARFPTASQGEGRPWPGTRVGWQSIISTLRMLKKSKI